jgi:hypothetical protein
MLSDVGSLHRVDVGTVSDISRVHAASIYKVHVTRVSQCSCMCVCVCIYIYIYMYVSV